MATYQTPPAGLTPIAAMFYVQDVNGSLTFWMNNGTSGGWVQMPVGLTGFATLADLSAKLDTAKIIVGAATLSFSTIATNGNATRTALNLVGLTEADVAIVNKPSGLPASVFLTIGCAADVCSIRAYNSSPTTAAVVPDNKVYNFRIFKA